MYSLHRDRWAHFPSVCLRQDIQQTESMCKRGLVHLVQTLDRSSYYLPHAQQRFLFCQMWRHTRRNLGEACVFHVIYDLMVFSFFLGYGDKNIFGRPPPPRGFVLWIDYGALGVLETVPDDHLFPLPSSQHHLEEIQLLVFSEVQNRLSYLQLVPLQKSSNTA